MCPGAWHGQIFCALPPELRWPVIGGLIVAAIGALVLTPIGNWLQSQLTTRETNAEALRVTYYRVSGLGLRLLTNGCLTPEWLKVFGLHPSVVNNPVLTEDRSFLDEYGTPLDGDILFGDYPKVGEYPKDKSDNLVQISEIMRSTGCLKKGQPAGSDMNTYLAGKGGWQLFVPDTRAAATVFGTLDWPSDYEFSSATFVNLADFSSASAGYLLSIWRYITAADLAQYERQYHEYETRIIANQHFEASYSGSNIYNEEPSHFNIVRSLRYITQGGVPDGFMVVVGGPETHGGWAFSARVRDLELLVAVYENVTGSPINIGDFSYRELTQHSLRTEDESSRQFEKSSIENRLLYPIRTLKPGEFYFGAFTYAVCASRAI